MIVLIYCVIVIKSEINYSCRIFYRQHNLLYKSQTASLLLFGFA